MTVRESPKTGIITRIKWKARLCMKLSTDKLNNNLLTSLQASVRKIVEALKLAGKLFKTPTRKEKLSS